MRARRPAIEPARTIGTFDTQLTGNHLSPDTLFPMPRQIGSHEINLRRSVPSSEILLGETASNDARPLSPDPARNLGRMIRRRNCTRVHRSTIDGEEGIGARFVRRSVTAGAVDSAIERERRADRRLLSTAGFSGLFTPSRPVNFATHHRYASRIPPR